MAFSAGEGGLSRGRYRGATGNLSEINVVPLVDVVLVLLVIFMITAHVMEIGLEVDVPRVTQTRETTKDLPMVTLTRDNEIYLADKPANINQLGQLVRARYPGATEVYVRADKNALWDTIAQVFSKLGEANFKVNAVTIPADEAMPARR